jgi:hypothetical protein
VKELKINKKFVKPIEEDKIGSIEMEKRPNIVSSWPKNWRLKGYNPKNGSHFNESLEG